MVQNKLNNLNILKSNVNILYIDKDENIDIEILKLLNTISLHVYKCGKIDNILDIIKNNKIDIILADLDLDNKKSSDILETINNKYPDIRKIILSKQISATSLLRGFKLEIDDFLTKPLDKNEFINSINKAIKKIDLKIKNEKNLFLLKQYKDITNTNSIISKTDINGIITYVNKNFCLISGYTQEELIGKPHSIVRHPNNSKKMFEKFWHRIKIEKKPWKGIVKNLSKDGKDYYVKTVVKPMLDEDGNIIEFMALRNDISGIMSDKKQLFASLSAYKESILVIIQLANFDILDKFYDSKTVEKIEDKFANIILNLFPNKNIFQRIFKLEDGVFALSEKYSNLLNIDIEKELLTLINNTKKETIKFDNIEYDVSIAISYSFGKNNLYANAKYGITKALKNANSLICANNLIDEAKENARKNIQTIHMVKKALDTQNIISYFQEIIDNKTKKIIKYESLVRLVDEKGEIISPFFFLDISKKSSYYLKITQRVIENSFKVLDHIKHNVSINLSILDIENEEIRKKLISLVSKPKYKGRVTFELLEDEQVKDFKCVKDFITLAKEVGDVTIAIDDFGAGYSNFERLLDYSPDILKIDGSLIKNIENDKFSKNIVETIVAFAKKQNIKTIAEYVENENIYNILNEMGIDYSQGFYFGKPKKLI